MKRPSSVKELDKMISNNHEGRAPKPSIITKLLDDLKETRSERDKLMEYIYHDYYDDNHYCCCDWCVAFRKTEIFKKTGVVDV